MNPEIAFELPVECVPAPAPKLQLTDAVRGRKLIQFLMSSVDWKRAAKHGLNIESMIGQLADALGYAITPMNFPLPFPNTETARQAHEHAGTDIYHCIGGIYEEDDLHRSWQQLRELLATAKLILRGSHLQSANALGDFLASRGWIQLGAGCYSVVYTRLGSSKVVKINKDRDAVIDYLIWANEEGFGGKEAPKVYSYRTFPDGTYAVLMERLEFTIQQAAGPRWLKAWDSLRDELRDGYGPGGKEPREFVKRYRDRFQNYGSDLHNQNFMLRKDGTCVLVDPFTSGERSKMPMAYTKRRLAA